MSDENGKACGIFGFIFYNLLFFFEKGVNVFLFGLQLSLLVLQLLYNTTTCFTVDTELGRKITEEIKVCKVSIVL